MRVECVRVALLIKHSTRMRHIATSYGPCDSTIFSTLSHKRYDFRKKLLNVKCVFYVSLQLSSETFFSLRRIQRDIVINVKTSSCKVAVILVVF